MNGTDVLAGGLPFFGGAGCGADRQCAIETGLRGPGAFEALVDIALQDGEELNPIRFRLLELLETRGTDLKNASLAIGKNAVYLHHYVHRGSPPRNGSAPPLASPVRS